MRTVSTAKGGGQKTTGSRKPRKKKKSVGGATTGVTEADLRRFGIVPVKGGTTGSKAGGKKKAAKSSSAPAGSGKSRRRRKGGKGRSVGTSAAPAAAPATAMTRTTGARRLTTGRRGTVGRLNVDNPQGFVGVAAQAGVLGGGALLANVVGGGLSNLAGWGLQQLPWFRDLDTRKPWYKLGWNALLLYLVANNARGESGVLGRAKGINLGRFITSSQDPLTGQRRHAYLDYLRYGMVTFFGFTFLYNLIRAGAEWANWNLDRPDKWYEKGLAYVAGSNGMLSEYDLGGAGTTGGLSRLFDRSDYVERLAEALAGLREQRDSLTTALDGIYGDLTDQQFGVFTAASDYVAALSKRIELAESEEDLDLASEFVVQGIQLGAIAQALLSGLTAGVGDQVVSQQMLQQLTPVQQQAVLQQAAQQLTPAQQQALQQLPPAQQQAVLQQAALQQQAVLQQALQQQAALQGQTVVEMQDGAQVVLDQTMVVPGVGPNGEQILNEVDVASAQQVMVQTGPGSVGVNADYVSQTAAAIAQAWNDSISQDRAAQGRGPVTPNDPDFMTADKIMELYLQFLVTTDGRLLIFGNGQNYQYQMGATPLSSMPGNNNAFMARTSPGVFANPGQTGARPVYGNWAASPGGMTAGGSGPSAISLVVNGRVVACPTSGPGLTHTVGAVLDELGIG